MERLQKLESLQAEELSRVPADEVQQWISMPMTKALLLQIEIDREQLKELWEQGNYPDERTDAHCRGQSEYASNIKEYIQKGMKFDD